MDTITEKMNIRGIEKKVFWLMTFVLFASVFSYMYFVKQTVFNIVERDRMVEELVGLSSQISEYEFYYIALKNDINLDYAHSVGFVDVKNPKFASRKLSNQNLTMATAD